MRNYLVCMRSALLMLAVLVGGCTTESSPVHSDELVAEVAYFRAPGPPVATLHADTSFTAAERVDLDAAAALWGVQTSGLAVIRIVYDLDFLSVTGLKAHVDAGHHTIRRMQEWMPLVKAMDDGDDGATLAQVVPAGGIRNPWRKPISVYFVMDRMGGEQYPERGNFRQTALHEFGHVLGVPHQEARYAIMYKHTIAAEQVCLKKPDLAGFCATTECGTYKTYPCD